MVPPVARILILGLACAGDARASDVITARINTLLVGFIGAGGLVFEGFGFEFESIGTMVVSAFARPSIP
jgi:hypothetical protein